jgi:hypothetical protein
MQTDHLLSFVGSSAFHQLIQQVEQMEQRMNSMSSVSEKGQKGSKNTWNEQGVDDVLKFLDHLH